MGKEEIAAKLRQARLSAKKTQKEVADILGMTYQAISNYERGKTKVESDVLIKLCEIYGISVSDVLSNEPLNIKTKLPPSVESNPLLNTLISNAKQLNTEGLEKLVGYSDDLVSSGKYEKTKVKEKAM